MVPLALSGSGFAIVIGAYLGMVLLAYLFSPRDVTGRRRANGCIVGIVILFGLIVVAFAAWADKHIF